MNDENLTAKQMYRDYKRQYDALANVYCQARDRNPLSRFSKLAKVVWRAGILMDLWYRIAVKNEVKKYQGE